MSCRSPDNAGLSGSQPRARRPRARVAGAVGRLVLCGCASGTSIGPCYVPGLSHIDPRQATVSTDTVPQEASWSRRNWVLWGRRTRWCTRTSAPARAWSFSPRRRNSASGIYSWSPDWRREPANEPTPTPPHAQPHPPHLGRVRLICESPRWRLRPGRGRRQRRGDVGGSAAIVQLIRRLPEPPARRGLVQD